MRADKGDQEGEEMLHVLPAVGVTVHTGTVKALRWSAFIKIHLTSLTSLNTEHFKPK